LVNLIFEFVTMHEMKMFSNLHI